LYACSFYSTIAQPAFEAAGWHTPEPNIRWTRHTLRHVFCTTALIEWKLDLTGVASSPATPLPASQQADT